MPTPRRRVSSHAGYLFRRRRTFKRRAVGIEFTVNVTATPPARLRYARTLARPPRRAALRIAVIYAIFGAAWILFTDAGMEALFSKDAIHRYHIPTIKGWTFIAV